MPRLYHAWCSSSALGRFPYPDPVPRRHRRLTSCVSVTPKCGVSESSLIESWFKAVTSLTQRPIYPLLVPAGSQCYTQSVARRLEDGSTQDNLMDEASPGQAARALLGCLGSLGEKLGIIRIRSVHGRTTHTLMRCCRCHTARILPAANRRDLRTVQCATVDAGSA
ncbi:hypothetical protein N657DRAFT_71803 [Parathielavia appendiculata]|uniref:Uncharacterized protein n=1 Tax=Parathielavia appendiculata TaxID=2587402 RepID=A0AAN6UAH3_9PEZI|nr:hypothetical protein N657DRAFT_71803 [Parathielavia appendiculata]